MTRNIGWSHGTLGAGRGAPSARGRPRPVRGTGLRTDHRRPGRRAHRRDGATFFRHFADKREVLFAGSALLQERLADAIAAVDPDRSPFDAAVTAVAQAFDGLGVTRSPQPAAAPQ